MCKDLAITVDIGTTNCKVSLYKICDGTLLARDKFSTYKQTDDYGELFDYKKIFDNLKEIFINYNNKYSQKIDSITFASVGEAGVLLDKAGVVVTPMIAWFDSRSHKYIDNLSEEEKEYIYQVAGLPAHTNYSLSKIKWMLDNYKLDTSESYYWLNFPDLMVYLFTGNLYTEYSIASRTMAFDLNSKKWSQEILEIFGLEKNVKFPEIKPAGESLGEIDLDVFPEFGYKIAVKIAGHDHKVGAYGIKLKVGDLLNSTGTTEGLLLLTDKLHNNNQQFKSSISNGIYTNPEFFTLFSSMPGGGNIFKWFTDLFELDKDQFNVLTDKLYNLYMRLDLISESTVVTIPHFKGSGAPFKSSKSKGMMYNLTLDTNKEDILTSILVGLSLELKHVANLLDVSEGTDIYIIGPAVNNKLWLQMKADVLNKEIKAVLMDEVVSFGSLSLAYQDVNYDIPIQTILPRQQTHRLFNELYNEYKYFYDIKVEATEKYN